MFDFGIIDYRFLGRAKHLGDHYDHDVWEIVVRNRKNPDTAYRTIYPPMTDAPFWMLCCAVKFDEEGRIIE